MVIITCCHEQGLSTTVAVRRIAPKTVSPRYLLLYPMATQKDPAKPVNKRGRYSTSDRLQERLRHKRSNTDILSVKVQSPGYYRVITYQLH